MLMNLLWASGQALFIWPINEQQRTVAWSKDRKTLYIRNSRREKFVKAAEDGRIEKILYRKKKYIIVLRHSDARPSKIRTVYGGLRSIAPGLKKGMWIRRHTIIGEIGKKPEHDLIFQILDAGKPVMHPEKYLGQVYFY